MFSFFSSLFISFFFLFHFFLSFHLFLSFLSSSVFISFFLFLLLLFLVAFFVPLPQILIFFFPLYLTPIQMATDKPVVLIVGAGLGGLSLGILLERAQIPFEIFERTSTVKPLGTSHHRH